MLCAGAAEITEHDSRLYFTVGDLSDISRVPIHLYLESPDIDITAVEICLGVPVGASLSTGTLNTILCDATHELVEGDTAESRFVSIASEDLKSFSSGEEPLCSWTCDLSSLPDGSYSITGTGVFAVGTDSEGVNSYVAADQSETLTVNEGEVTGIEEVRCDTGTLTIYNLQGMRLAAPEKGQINIINGKKVKL